jgi:hypothetical protein
MTRVVHCACGRGVVTDMLPHRPDFCLRCAETRSRLALRREQLFGSEAICNRPTVILEVSP